MAVVQRRFTVDTAPDVVLRYLKDFSNTEQWDPGTRSCTRNDSGPIVVGSSWQNRSTIAGISTELTYTLERVAPDQLVFIGKNARSTTTDTITVTASGQGAQIHYHVRLRMRGLARFADPIVRLVFEKVAHDTRRHMTEVLNGLH